MLLNRKAGFMAKKPASAFKAATPQKKPEAQRVPKFAGFPCFSFYSYWSEEEEEPNDGDRTSQAMCLRKDIKRTKPNIGG